LEAYAEVAHYGKQAIDGAAAWRLTDDAGRVVGSGSFPRVTVAQGGVTGLGDIRVPLAGFKKAAHLKLTVELRGTEVREIAQARNDWNLWVYPETVNTLAPAGVLVTTTWQAATSALAQGKRVLLHSPQGGAMLPARFLPIFWSKAWGGPSFTGQPSNMGVLCDPAHPALADFPTAMHSDFQWWELAEASHAFILNDTPQGFRPIVQVIDDFHRNYKLGTVIEAAVGTGKLLATSYDLSRDLEQRPVARQLLYSLMNYAAKFEPKAMLTAEEIGKIAGR
jgi:hypothetical protein